jgi:ATP-dependent exoDNAse (exonuclease V) alpha subunit
VTVLVSKAEITKTQQNCGSLRSAPARTIWSHRPRIQAPNLSIYHLQISNVSRGRGRTSVGTAAYIARENLRDERSGRVHDHRRRGGLEHAEIIVPRDFAAADIASTQSREKLWNAAERAERRGNARVARQYQIALPHELTAPQRLQLAQRFAHDIADRYGVVADLALHSAPPGGDTRNRHAHVLTTTRELTTHGLGEKSRAEWNDGRRRAAGRPDAAAEFRLLRARWAEMANSALREAGFNIRVDHRSLAAQGIDREPQRPKPRAAVEQERRARAKSQFDLQPDRAALQANTDASKESALRQLPAKDAGQRTDVAQSAARNSWLNYVRQQQANLSRPETEQAADATATPRRDVSNDQGR